MATDPFPFFDPHGPRAAPGTALPAPAAILERGLDRRAVTFGGHWRRGLSEEQLLARSLSGAAPPEDD
ncbi:hypothetical protein ACFYM0_28875 [Streptomyces sp. NPDC006487]|uniref:hypothetical protein n=1 Tax=Streptomyces sp. NPDC006487 TaxID=3364748 RepID=UPI00368A2650